MKPSIDDLDLFTKGYIECALWATLDSADASGGQPLDANYGYNDLSEKAVAQIVEDCKAFQDDNASDLKEYYDQHNAEDYAGHDYFLTRNGHGAGFWDRGLGALGKRLSDAAKVYKDFYIYVGDDGLLYC